MIDDASRWSNDKIIAAGYVCNSGFKGDIAEEIMRAREIMGSAAIFPRENQNQATLSQWTSPSERGQLGCTPTIK